MKVEKRDGSIVAFEGSKIVTAIEKAMAEVENGLDHVLAETIAKQASLHFAGQELVNIEQIQDFVEIQLMRHTPEVAKKYIIYRLERAKLRQYGWEMTELQRDIYEKKYRNEQESFDSFLTRVSGGNEKIKKAIRDKKFMPAGRILAGRGLAKTGRKLTLSNCYVLPKVEDNLEDIFDTAKHLARIFSYGGGVGFNLSKLRPRGSKVNNAAITTTGAVSFMDLYSMVTGLIGMKGRRGALMLNMDIRHPDIEEFINAKNDLSKVNYANISVNITDDFMEAVEKDQTFELFFHVEATGEEIRKIKKARELYRAIALNNWNTAEPGLLFQNRIDSWHLLSEDETFHIDGVNPCAEEPLPAYGSCNLASINLSEFVLRPFQNTAAFDYQSFRDMVKSGVDYLNEVLEENLDMHPLIQQRFVSDQYRQIGLGIMGMADMFLKMGIVYGSEESIDLIQQIGREMINVALQESALLAREYGSFPRYNREKILLSPFLKANATQETLELVSLHGLRNSQLLTIAPTGSISTLLGCSNGLEPIFQNSYVRKSESLRQDNTYYKIFTPIVKKYMEDHLVTREEELPDFFVTAANVPYMDRIRVQSTWQEHIDASISSTVNLANSSTVEMIEDLYLNAWKMGLKGITIYREGCSRTGILLTDQKTNRKDKILALRNEINQIAFDELKDNPYHCPICGGHMNHSGGCMECQDCGYSPCSI